MKRSITQRSHHETAANYHGVVAVLNVTWRVVTRRDALQWILQRRDAMRAGRVRWTGARYFHTRDALIDAIRALCGLVDPAALSAVAALPDLIGGAG